MKKWQKIVLVIYAIAGLAFLFLTPLIRNKNAWFQLGYAIKLVFTLLLYFSPIFSLFTLLYSAFTLANHRPPRTVRVVMAVVSGLCIAISAVVHIGLYRMPYDKLVADISQAFLTLSPLVIAILWIALAISCLIYRKKNKSA